MCALNKQQAILGKPFDLASLQSLASLRRIEELEHVLEGGSVRVGLRWRESKRRIDKGAH